MAEKGGKVWKYVGAFALLWILLRATKPKWYQDLMLRAFASDQVAEPGKSPEAQQQFEQAADLAARALLPLGWVLKVAEITTGVTLEQAVQKVQQKVLDMGPPADTSPETLAKYRDTAIAAAKT
jgi:hypothetical protein